MGDMRSFTSEGSRVVSIDPYALVSAIMGSQIERRGGASSSSSTVDGLQADYDELVDVNSGDNDNDRNRDRQGPKPDQAPKKVCVGAANPYAMVEAILGRKVDKTSIEVARIMSDVLQTDYDELFDMKHRSVLYAGLQLNGDKKMAEQVSQKDMKILNENDLITPDLSRVEKLKDLEKIGLKDLDNAKVKMCRLHNGKLRLILHADRIGRTVSNKEVTRSINDLITPFRHNSDNKNKWTPPNSSWRDGYDYFFQMFNSRLINDINQFYIGGRPDQMLAGAGGFLGNNQQSMMLAQAAGIDTTRRGVQFNRFDDPVQGCAPNSWFVSALFSVFWADPCFINRDTRLHSSSQHRGGRGGGCGSGHMEEQGSRDRQGSERYLEIKFHSQGGDNNSKTRTVEVNYDIPINNSNNQPLYCRSSDGADIWPSLYEKAFTKWVTETDSEHPDITQLHCGDPIKAMAQINGRTPHYYECRNHAAMDLIGLVRANCVNFKTINPMCAFTYATGQQFCGSNLVANHAYSVLGYIVRGDRHYVVLRNPWGVTEPQGLTAYQGLLTRVDPEMWTPAALLDHGGLFALEVDNFKHCFQYIGVAK
ncbi:hypothetical protein RB598_008912 [Gaeumannomyces tritici]